MTDQQIKDEIRRVLDTTQMSRQELAEKSRNYELDASFRGALGNIEALEWLLKRH